MKVNIVDANEGKKLASKLVNHANLTSTVDRERRLIRNKRSVRPAKSYEFKESDGANIGQVVITLDKKHDQEVFKIESPNRWVTVDTGGSVRVKEQWDYEQLDKHKSIDFWVFIAGPNLPGMYTWCLHSVVRQFSLDQCT